MEDPIIKQLKDEIAKSEARIAQLRNTLATYLGKNDVTQKELALSAAPQLTDLSDYSQTDAVRQILRESIHALTRDEIVQIAARRGKELTVTSLPSLLSRNKGLFSHLGGGRWILVQKAPNSSETAS